MPNDLIVSDNDTLLADLRGLIQSTRERVAMGFLLSPERLTTVVNGYYLAYLGCDLDAAGQSTWVGIL